MAPTRTKTVKNKHAANKSGIKGSKSSKNPDIDPVSRSKKPQGKNSIQTPLKGRPSISDILKKRKKRVYTEKELDIPKLNMITPVGVEKPKGKKKGKVFVDDRESMATILAIVQAEKEGQIESKILKARQMEEIREARKAEAEKKEAERQAKFDDTKESLRKKRKRPVKKADEDDNISAVASTGTKAAKPKKRKSVSFADE